LKKIGWEAKTKTKGYQSSGEDNDERTGKGFAGSRSRQKAYVNKRKNPESKADGGGEKNLRKSKRGAGLPGDPKSRELVGENAREPQTKTIQKRNRIGVQNEKTDRGPVGSRGAKPKEGGEGCREQRGRVRKQQTLARTIKEYRNRTKKRDKSFPDYGD